MAGKQLHQAQTKDFSDPFNVGQMVGMLIILSFIEQNNGINDQIADRIKWACAENAQEYFDATAEDIFLMTDNMIKEIINL